MRSTRRQWNGVWNFVNNVQRWRIPDQAGGNGLPDRSIGTETDETGAVITAGDPRIVWYEAGPAFDDNVTHYSQLRYGTREDPMPIATGAEARLIEAEAALAGGDTGTFVEIHNALRAGEEKASHPLRPPTSWGRTMSISTSRRGRTGCGKRGTGSATCAG
jgi:hypothetical protein